MSAFAGPSTVENGLVFAYDMANTNKSWKGAPITNEAKNASNQVDWSVSGLLQAVSRTTVVANEVYNITSTTGTGTSFRIYFANAVLTNGATYTVSYKYKIISGGPLFRANDWCDTSITRVTTDLGGGVFYETATGTRATYDATFRFLDFEISNNSVVQIWDLQLELGSYATPYSSTRVRSSTQAILDLIGLNTINAVSLTYNSNNTFSFNGSTDRIYQTSIPASYSTVTNSLGRSWEIFVRPATSQTIAALFGHKVGAGCSYFCNGGFYVSNGRFTFNWFDNAAYQFLDSTVTATLDQNFYLAGTYDPTDLKCRIYVNGELKATSAVTNMNYLGSITESSVGWNSKPENPDFFNGSIPAARYYSNKTLTQAEVKQNFNALRGRFGV